MAEKFCKSFGNGPHQLKIGKTFEKKSSNNAVFHSIRYDFTPLSVDEDRMGKLEVQENSAVSVSLPHNDGVNATNYKGSAKPASTKECILIIDHETGELTLERLSNQILLKKTRAEKPERHTGGGGMGGLTLPTDGPSQGGSSSNPYLVKAEPEKPHNPYTVMREPDKPRLPNGRPVTPQLKPKKQSPLPKSPSRSNTNSPVRLPAQPTKGQGLSESSDSGSSSSSDSDSDSDSNGSSNEKSCPLSAAMEASSSSSSAPFSMPGDFNDLFLPGAGSNTVGSLPTARPQKHKKPDKMKHKEKVQTPVNSYRPETESKNSLGVDGSGTSMPNLFTDLPTDLGDDLQLTESDED